MVAKKPKITLDSFIKVTKMKPAFADDDPKERKNQIISEPSTNDNKKPPIAVTIKP